MNADRQRYGHLKLELSNSYSRGRDEYPDDLPSAHQLLLTYKGPRNDESSPKDGPRQGRGNGSRGGRSDRGQGDAAWGDGGRGGKNTTPGRGHEGGRGGGESNNNISANSARRSLSQFNLSQAKQIEDHFPNGIPDHYVLLDSNSTVSIFRNKEYLSDVRDADFPLHLQTNGGLQTTHKIGTITDIGDVWYNPNSIANILSLAQVRKVRRVTMDTGIEAAFYVHRPDGNIPIFYEHPSGLYLHDVSKGSNNSNSPAVIAYSNLQTVADNKAKYTNRQVEMVDQARKLHHLLGRPSTKRLIQALAENQIINCPITVDDVKRAEDIYGKDVAFIKGKTTAKPPKDHIDNYVTVPLPTELAECHCNVTLCFDIFYVLRITFSISVSRNLKYISCRYLKDRNRPTIMKCINNDLQLYRDRGFNVTNIHSDGEYHTFATNFPGVHFSICSVDDHVPEAERAIRTIKETVRSTIHGMPFQYLPRLMVRERRPCKQYLASTRRHQHHNVTRHHRHRPTET